MLQCESSDGFYELKVIIEFINDFNDIGKVEISPNRINSHGIIKKSTATFMWGNLSICHLDRISFSISTFAKKCWQPFPKR